MIGTAVTGHRNYSLDGLRGIAILLVVADHSGIPFVMLGGATGVTLFFVLSGYLITSLLLREQDETGTVSLRKFYARRALRLLPALIVALIGGTILATAFGASLSETLTAAAMCLFYIGNLWPILGTDHLFPFGNLWSLALEEQYYLLWPIFLLLFKRFKTTSLIVVTAVLTGVSLIMRFTGPIGTDTGYAHAYYLPQSSVWAILAGCLTALILKQRPQLTIPPWTWTAGITVLLLTSTVMGMRTGLHPDTSTLTRITILAAGPVAAVCAVILVVNCVTRTAPSGWLVHPILLFFGQISYALYLWAGTIHKALALQFHPGGVYGLAVGVASAVLAVGAATASRRWVETPFLRMKRRFEQTPDARQTTSDAEPPPNPAGPVTFITDGDLRRRH